MIKKYFSNKEGIAATEFALISPVLLAMLIGIFDYGLYVNNLIKMENVAYAAAQYIRSGGNENNLASDVFLESSLGLSAESISDLSYSVTEVYECSDGLPTTNDADCGDGDYLRRYVEVDLSMDYNPLIPYPEIFGLPTVSGSARMQGNL